MASGCVFWGFFLDVVLAFSFCFSDGVAITVDDDDGVLLWQFVVAVFVVELFFPVLLLLLQLMMFCNPPRVTWVHPSSLLGWYPVSRFVFYSLLLLLLLLLSLLLL